VLYPADATQTELEQLIIMDWHPEREVIKPIKALAERCPQQLPRLRRIEFLGEQGKWNARMDPLMSEADLEHGVELRVTHEEYWYKRHLPDYVFEI
jgi:hypothetical protein